MKENDISREAIGAAIEVHRNLGPGLLESVYEEAFCYELSARGLRFERQCNVPIRYRNVRLATQLRLDVVVEDKLIVETKAKQETTDLDKQQLLTYLRLRNLHLGLIINFNVRKLVDGVHRIANELPET